jgi:hypothetical protein
METIRDKMLKDFADKQDLNQLALLVDGLDESTEKQEEFREA